MTSQPRVHKWAGSTTGWVLLWKRDRGTDTWCPAKKPFSKIMFFNHLATFGTIYKSAKGPQVGQFHNGMGPVVEPGQWCGHMVSGHGTNVSNHVFQSFGNFWHHLQVSQGSTSGSVPQRDGSCCGTRAVARTYGVRPWNQCLKSCFLIIWQLLAPFTSQPRVHKWVGSTTGWVLLWNQGSGVDIWCPAMEPMSQIMFFNHLATFGTIYKSANCPQVGWFHNVMGPVVEQGQWCGHL